MRTIPTADERTRWPPGNSPPPVEDRPLIVARCPMASPDVRPHCCAPAPEAAGRVPLSRRRGAQLRHGLRRAELLPPSPPIQQNIIARDQMRFCVLVGPARTNEVDHQADHVPALNDARYHELTTTIIGAHSPECPPTGGSWP